MDASDVISSLFSLPMRQMQQRGQWPCTYRARVMSAPLVQNYKEQLRVVVLVGVVGWVMQWTFPTREQGLRPESSQLLFVFKLCTELFLPPANQLKPL